MSDQAVLEEEVVENFEELTEPVNVLNHDDDIEVEVVSDVPETDRNRPPRAETSGEDSEEEDDSQFSNRVQKRIGKLRYEWLRPCFKIHSFCQARHVICLHGHDTQH